jgi:hypothetical protein
MTHKLATVSQGVLYGEQIFNRRRTSMLSLYGLMNESSCCCKKARTSSAIRLGASEWT